MTNKERCRAVKEARKKFVELEGLEVVISECKHEGECPSPCSSYEDELKNISIELERRTSWYPQSHSKEFKCKYECSIEGLLSNDMEEMEVVSIKHVDDEYDIINAELEDIGLSEYTF